MHVHLIIAGMYRSYIALAGESVPHSGMWLLDVNAPPKEKYHCSSSDGTYVTIIIIVIADRSKPEKPFNCHKRQFILLSHLPKTHTISLVRR